MKLLFLCSRNHWRSPTAEAVYQKDPRVEVRSAGVSASARRLPKLGLLLSLPLLVFVVSTAGDEFHWKDALLNAAILTALSYVVFVKGLSLTLPVWPTFMTAAS